MPGSCLMREPCVTSTQRSCEGTLGSVLLTDKWLKTPANGRAATGNPQLSYGEIYPVTLQGKVMCVLYAMILCPHSLLPQSPLLRHLATGEGPKRSQRLQPLALEDGTVVFSHEVVVREPLDIRQVLHSQADVRHKSIQLQNNREIFEKILARDNLLQKGPLLRTVSCPELNQMPPPPKGYAIWDFTGLGDGMDMLDVPFLLIIFIVFAYIFFFGLILPRWETEFEGFDPYYFCFITLTTIGFGDIVPNHPKYFMVTSLFIIVGMAIMSMAFKLSQARIVFFYRHFLKFISKGNVEPFSNGLN
ncbi:Potassium channel subfamily K member 18 [Takifugu flavidus]|uniref:Potassium channel subfamily K member 18 n=1 Tax=Takifugu flavidus TaxID=433684 RepID=A0A5C6MHX0_9TELE|nr:Potassium channel subfamily K member 18 [Takifugu flavidus]